jgi:acetyltransferase-like isoleucine patch superfamily enzyme
LSWDWYGGRIPENVFIHENAYLETTYSFQRFQSRIPQALKIGAGSSIYLGVMFDLGEKASMNIGDYVLMNGARIICDCEITIGDYSLISWNVVMMDTYRIPFETAARRVALEEAAVSTPRRAAGPSPARPIRIGQNVWIGFDSCILPGVTIGDGAVVGARSVIVEDVPPLSIAVGNPARVIRRIEEGENPAMDREITA